MSVMCLVEDVKRLAPINAAWSGFNSAMETIIPAASEQIRTFCRRKFDLGEYTQYFASPDSMSTPSPRRLHLNESPIAAGTVFIDFDYTGRFTTIEHIYGMSEGTDFTIEYDTGIIHLLADTSYNARGMRVIYTGGYAVANETPPRVQVPAQVAMACAMQTAFLLERNFAAQTGQSSDDSKNTEVTFTISATSGLIGESQSMVLSFRRPLVGRT